MKVSVVIPCRNGEALLAPTIESVLNQTLPPFEIIVADNGSTDQSIPVAREFGVRVQVVSEPRPGASLARNTGFAAATGDAVMFLDADDLLGPTAQEALSAVLENCPDAVACCPWFRLEAFDGCWLSLPASCAHRRFWHDDLGAWLTGWYHPPCSVLWSRAAYERTGGWSPDVRVNQDGDIMMRGLVLGNRLVRTSAGAAYYRRLPGGQVSLSGTRLSRRGLESRLLVLGRVADLLRERGRLWRYRGPLGEAYDTLAEDCENEPDLQRQSLAEAAHFAGAPWRRRVRALPGRALTSLRWRAKQLSDAIEPAPDLPCRHTAPRPYDPPLFSRDGEPSMVSVVIPTFNRAHLLPRAVASVLAQTYEHFELLVVDDGSTDGTAQVMSSFFDPRIRYLPLEQNRGVAAARNVGLREARGEYIAFLDSDDEWMPEKLGRQIAIFAQAAPSTGLVYCGVEMVGRSGDEHILMPLARGEVHGQLLLENVVAGGSCAMIRKKAVAMVGHFDERLPAIEDYEYLLRIARFYQFDFVPQVLVRYQDTDTADATLDKRRRSRDFLANFEARHLFYSRNRHEMRHAGVEHLFLMESAKRHLRWPYGSPATGRRILVQAILGQPRALKLYAWLFYAALPPRLAPMAGTLARFARNALTPLVHGRP